MTINGFYPISLASILVLTWQHSLKPPAVLILLAVVWVNVAIHELGHVAVVRCTGGRVIRLTIKPWHGVIILRQEDRLAFAVTALAGPAAGLMAGGTALFVLGQLSAPWVVTAVGVSLHAILWAGICDNALNLLPVGVLDGRQFVNALREWRVQQRWIEHLREMRLREVPEPPPAVVAPTDAAPSWDIPKCRRLLTPATST
jgi:Zn-dependent protease